MKEYDRAFSIGIFMLVVALALTAVLQVTNRIQTRARNRARAEIVRTQQDHAAAQALFAAMTRPEVLRALISEVYPNFVPIRFANSVSAADIPMVPPDEI